MRRFAYAGDNGNGLIVRSPKAGVGKGLVCTDTIFDNYELTIAFRVLFSDTTGNQYLFYNSETAVPKNENYFICVVNGELFWNDPTTGNLKLMSGLQADILYNIWIDIYEEQIIINCYSSAGSFSQTYVKSAYYASDSYMCIFNHRTSDQYLKGTMFDIVAIGGMGSSYELWKTGGISWLTLEYWSCREGTGTVIYSKRSGIQLYLGHFTGIDWTSGTQDDCKRWS